MRRRIILWMLLTAAAGSATAAVAFAGGGGVNYTNVPAANVKAAGYVPSDVLSPELRQSLVAQGSMALDGAQGAVGWYGYINDAPSPDDSTLPQMVGTPAPRYQRSLLSSSERQAWKPFWPCANSTSPARPL